MWQVELAIELGADGQPTRAAVAIDMTARDVQVRVWSFCRCFHAACASEREGLCVVGRTSLHCRHAALLARCMLALECV